MHYNLDGVTPDWIIKNQLGEILFIIEVLTRENSNKNKSLSKRIDELWAKITNIKIGVGLDLERIKIAFTDEISDS